MSFRTTLKKIGMMWTGRISIRDEVAEYSADLDSPFAQINGKDKYSVPVHPNQEVLKLIEYPSRPSGIQSFNEQSILSLYREKLQTVQMLLAIGDSDIREDAFSFTNLVLKPLIEFIRWVHLLPASENHHHNGIGGLFSHSLDVAILSLKNAYHSELRPIGYQDEEVQRRKIYLYAAFISGLVHDAGKIYDVDVISVNVEPPQTWTPSKHSLLDWARENNIYEYEIVWRSRIHNQHNIWSGIFLERILNSVCLAYLDLVIKERVYSKMLLALNFYNDGNDYLSKCVRKADYFSTGTDLNVMRDPVMGLRSNDAAARALGSLKHNFQKLNINDFKSKPMHLIIINGEVYLNENAFLDFVLADFEKMNFNFPQGDAGRTVLTEALVQRGYVEPYNDERVVHYFIPGVFNDDDIARIFVKGIANLEFYNLLKLKWVGLVFDSYKIPDSVPGLFSINANKDFLYVDEKRSLAEFRRPVPGREDVTKISDTVESLAADIRTVNPAPLEPVNEIIDESLQSEEGTLHSQPENVDTAPHYGNTDINANDGHCDAMSDLGEDLITSSDGQNCELQPDDAVEEQDTAAASLQAMITAAPLPQQLLKFVDSVPYLVVDEIKTLLPALEDKSFCAEPFFQKTYRDGALSGHWIVRDVHEVRLVQLGDCCAGIHIGERSSQNTTELKSLLESSMYQTLSIEPQTSDNYDDDYSRDAALELPPQRLNSDTASNMNLNNNLAEVSEQFTTDYEYYAVDQADEECSTPEDSYQSCFNSSDIPPAHGPELNTAPHDPISPGDGAIQPAEHTTVEISHKPHLSPALARLFAVPTACLTETQEDAAKDMAGSIPEMQRPSSEVESTRVTTPASEPAVTGTFTLLTEGSPTHEEYEQIAHQLASVVIKMKEFFNSTRKNRFTLLVDEMLYITQAGIKRFETELEEGSASVFIQLPVYRVNSGVIKNTKCFQFDMNQLLAASDRINIDLSSLLDDLLEQ